MKTEFTTTLDANGYAEHPTGWGPGGFTLPSHWDD